jgi:hypothetical protein
MGFEDIQTKAAIREREILAMKRLCATKGDNDLDFILLNKDREMFRREVRSADAFESISLFVFR